MPVQGEPAIGHVLEAASDSASLHSSTWRADQTGLWRLATGAAAVKDPAARRLIPGPIGSESHWAWDIADDSVVQQRAGEVMQPFFLGELHVCELVAMDEQIRVPAGTFRTLRIRTKVARAHYQNDEWFAPGIGLVRSERVHGTKPFTDRQTRELLRYELGIKPAVDPAAVLKGALAPDHEHRVTWLPPSPHVRGRFAVVRSAASPTTCWYVTDKARALEVEKPAAWQPVFEALRAEVPQFSIEVPERPAPSEIQFTTTLATLIAELEAGRRELRAGTVIATNADVPEHAAETAATVMLAATDDSGTIYEMTARARVRDGVVRAAAVACKQAADRPLPRGR